MHTEQNLSPEKEPLCASSYTGSVVSCRFSFIENLQEVLTMGSVSLFSTFVRIIGNVNGLVFSLEMNSADYRKCIVRRTIVNTILCVIDGSHLLLSFVYSIDDYLTSYQHSNFNFPGRDMSAGVECMMDLWNCLI